MEINCTRLRHERKKRKLTIQEVAKMLGTSSATICRYENGTSKIPALTLVEFLQIYDLTLNDVLVQKVNVL